MTVQAVGPDTSASPCWTGGGVPAGSAGAPAAQVLSTLDTAKQGLSRAAASVRLAAVGPNAVVSALLVLLLVTAAKNTAPQSCVHTSTNAPWPVPTGPVS
jgi:hypothetical protein